MLTNPPVEKLIPKVSCSYELAVLVSKRASQLVDGAQKMVRDEGEDKSANSVSLACKEIADDRVVGVHKDIRPTSDSRRKNQLRDNEFYLPISEEKRKQIKDEKEKQLRNEEYKRSLLEIPQEEETAENSSQSDSRLDKIFATLNTENSAEALSVNDEAIEIDDEEVVEELVESEEE